MRRLVCVALVLAAVACGVPEDDNPQELTADEVPFGLLTTAPTTTAAPVDLPPSREAELYFIDADDEISPLDREVQDRTPEAVIQALLATETSGLPATYSSNIPPGTTLLDLSTDTDVLTVDLSEEFTTIEGERFIAAVAQIVFTATALEGINSVSFRVEGDRIPVSDEDGAAQEDPVSPNDYLGLLST